MPNKYDFSGYATKNDLVCSDGRVICKDAFKDCDGKSVPLVWHHIHDDPGNVLGHALLENREDGVYAYGFLNNTQNAEIAHELLANGDIQYMSIYANGLKQDGSNVRHGQIREVSLVLAGANPGAKIDYVAFTHSDGSFDESDEDAIIHTGIEIEMNDEMYHAEDDEDAEDDEADEDETVGDVLDSMTEDQRNAIAAVISIMVNNEDDEDDSESETSSVSHADTDDGPTIGEVFESMNDKQKAVAYSIIQDVLEQISENDEVEDEELEQSGMENDMKKNVFDGSATGEAVLTHDDFVNLMEDAKARGSFKEAFRALDDDKRNAFIAHTEYTGGDGRTYNTKAYGISNIGLLFPDARTAERTPQFIQREMDWVPKVMNGVRHVPYTRIRTMNADITADEARARGYVTGAQKVEEVFSLLKRETTPQTIYKKQKLDRDDILDITDFDVVSWIRSEMRMMLDEEIARAILIGDGRSNASADKIKEDNIRPIWKDDDLYTLKMEIDNATDIADIMDAILRKMDDFEGSAAPKLYTTRENLTSMLLIKDEFGHRLYKSVSEIADAIGVTDIIAVPVMKNQTRSVTISGSSKTATLFGVIVDLRDYDAGTDKGGQITSFDDFDIDYNQYKYLLETRMSGALTKVHSAIAIETYPAS